MKKFNRFTTLRRKEVTKMKKLIMLVMALAMVVAFMPTAYAADSAQLNLSVTFAVDQDLQNLAELTVLTNDLGAKLDRVYNDALQNPVPEVIHKALEILYPMRETDIRNVEAKLLDMLQRRPDLEPQISPVLSHVRTLAYTVSTYIAKLESLLLPPPIISIELNESAWRLDGVKLGEKRVNLNELGAPIHAVRNTGNTDVMIDIGYAPGMMYLEWAPKPGLEQGPNTFITALGRGPVDNVYTDVVIPPDGRLKVGLINPDNGIPLRLTYGAPTSLESVANGGPVAGMGTAYEIRAYGNYIKPVPYEPMPTPIPAE